MTPNAVTESARATAEAVARDSYGRLVAWLASVGGDVAAAEDALADAFVKALEHWARDGLPEAPEAWLLTAARRRLIDGARREATRGRAAEEIARAIEEAAADDDARNTIPDDRLRLMFICAHPAIDPAIRTPLMLQTALGVDAKRIAAAFLASPSAMAQRLVRAKRKIADARIPFANPDPQDLPARLGAVLDAVYAAFGADFDDAGGARQPFAEEALFLARLAARLAPDEPEPLGLVALMAFIHARAPARRAGGAYVPFDAQDTTRWDADLMAEAEEALGRAAAFQAPGRYQLEAAIQSAHVTRRMQGVDTREDVVRLYDRLIARAPSIGARVARAAALVAAGRAPDAISALDGIPPSKAATHQPYWAARAEAEAMLGLASADDSYARAIGLSTDEAARRFLARRRGAARKGG